jgi:hypothetical protein
VDLAEDGDSVTYFRRMMLILKKVSDKPGIALSKLMSLYTRSEIEDIYPAMSQVLAETLVEELALMNYLDVKEGKLYITKKGEEKLTIFIKTSLRKKDKPLKSKLIKSVLGK